MVCVQEDITFYLLFSPPQPEPPPPSPSLSPPHCSSAALHIYDIIIHCVITPLPDRAPKYVNPVGLSYAARQSVTTHTYCSIRTSNTQRHL